MKSLDELANEYAELIHKYSDEGKLADVKLSYKAGYAQGYLAAQTEAAKREAVLVEALQTAEQPCLCKRNTEGFDYHEEHLMLGKPKSGSRWLTPRDIITQALAQIGKVGAK